MCPFTENVQSKFHFCNDDIQIQFSLLKVFFSHSYIANIGITTNIFFRSEDEMMCEIEKKYVIGKFDKVFQLSRG